jgi:hypothetical protein
MVVPGVHHMGIVYKAEAIKAILAAIRGTQLLTQREEGGCPS